MIARMVLVIAFAAIGAIPGTAAPAPVTPGESPLSVVPAQAPIVVHVKGVERAKDRLTTLLKNALPDLGAIASAQVDEMFKTALEGRKLQGLDPAGPVFLAFLEFPTGDAAPPAALIARVTKYTDFRDGLLTDDERKSVKGDAAGYERAEIMGREYFFIDRGAYAVVTPHKETATQLTKKQPGLDGKISSAVGRKLLDADLSAYVNLAAVTKEYGDQLKAARQFMEAAIEAGPGAGTDKQSAEMAKAMFGAVFQMLDDGRALVLALEFRPEGLAVHLQAQVGADTPTNKLLKDQKPVALDAVATLPAGLLSYSATGPMGSDLLKAMAPMIYGVTSTEGEGKKALDAAIDQLIGAGQTASLGGANLPASGINVVTFQNPAQAVAAQVKLFRALGEGGTFQSAAIKGKPEIKENDQTYKGFTLHYARLQFDLDKLAEALPGGAEDMKKAFKKLIGEEVRTWFGTDGKRYVAVSAKEWPAAKAMLDAYLDGSRTLATEPAFAATRKQLPPEATMVSLADAGRFTQTMVDYMLAIMKAVPGLPFNLPDELKPVATKTSYLGFAMTLRPEHGAVDFYLPAAAVQEMRKVILPLFGG